MAARRFLWLILIGVALVVTAVIAYTLAGPALIRAATTPRVRFTASPRAAVPAYAPAPDGAPAARLAWLARPGQADDASRFVPAGLAPAPAPAAAAALFFVVPTAWLSAQRWNAPLDDPATNARLRVSLLAQASAFNGVARVWAPAYRQATFGAFLADTPDARAALDLAYGDVVRAWDAFLAANPTGPLILAGHSQGSLHLLRLVRERIAGTPAAARLVAVYAPGWPVSATADLPALGIPACGGPAATGCLLDWVSFAEPADAKLFAPLYARTPGWTGRSRAGTPVLCVNPLTGTPGGAAPAAANLGALRPGGALTDLPTLAPRAVAATCRPDGLLSVGPPPDGFGRFVLPGNNLHVYDYNLFWANIRADAARRLAAWKPARR